MIRSTWVAAALVVATGACATATTGPPRSADLAALRLFELSHADDLDPVILEELMDDALVEVNRAAAYEAVDSLRDASMPRVLSIEPLIGVERTAVDVAADLAGGGSARYSFQAEERSDGSWRIVSILAPGIEWPPRSSRGSGLSVSPPVGETVRAR